MPNIHTSADALQPPSAPGLDAANSLELPPLADDTALLLPQHHFGRNVRRIRQQSGLTQDALARRCARFKKQIPAIEDGAVVPTLSMILVLARALEVPPDLLLVDIICVTATR